MHGGSCGHHVRAIAAGNCCAATAAGTQHLLHMLQRGGGELVRCRTAWRPTPHTIAAGEALGVGGH
jgi:hypothetical protein